MRSYSDRWAMRPGKIDCTVCTGDARHLMEDGDTKMIQPLDCCAFTGLDEIPWTELFMIGRMHRNGQ